MGKSFEKQKILNLVEYYFIIYISNMFSAPDLYQYEISYIIDNNKILYVK
jgi:hypothetical protein